MRGVIFVVLLLMVPGAVCARQDESRIMTWQGIERHYAVHRPAQGLPSAAPLVVVLAGLGQDLESLHRWLPIDPVADRHGFIVAYPEAIGGKWSYWRGGGILVPAHATEEVDDVGFISAVVETLVKEGTADPKRVYVTGISRGALMSWTLACERADLFSAAAPLSSAMTAWQASNCHPSRPLPIVAVDGTEDPVQFYDGFIYPPPVPRLISVPETMAFWWRLSGCTGEKINRLPHGDADDRTRIERYEWTGCAGGGPIMLYRVIGGGHQPPSLATDASARPEHFGRRSRDMETAEEIWNAFMAVMNTQLP